MSPEEQARRIVHHHLGDTSWVIHRGSHPSVFVSWEKVEHLATAPTLDAAAAECAARLRSAGWEPSHARLEWERGGDGGYRLWLYIDKYAQLLFSVRKWSDGDFSMYVYHAPDERGPSDVTLAEVLTPIAEWCAAHFPNLHLPSFPEST